MNLIQKYRPHGIAVTDLSAQLWCEKQLEFSFEKGRVKTKEMQKGKERHTDLHEEIYVIIKVEPRTIEDFIAVRLNNCLIGLTTLLKGKITRELPIYGKVNSLFVLGSIDELMLKNGKLLMLDTKTRGSNNMPSESQKRVTRFQLMLYKHLFDSIKDGKFNHNDLLAFYNLNEKSTITKEIQKQFLEIGDNIEPNINKLSRKVFSMIKEFPGISDNLQIRYESQITKKLIGIDEFQFNAELFKRDCDFVEEFWLEKRKAIPVGESNKWKCNYCEFKTFCSNNTKTLNMFSDKQILS